MPFLDTLVTINGDGSLSTKVYRKKTHTDLYLQWDSHHSIAAKYSVINTLHHRARAVCSNKQLLEEEEEHLKKVLIENKYPMWALNRVKIKNKATKPKNKEDQRTLMPILQQAVRGHTWCFLMSKDWVRVWRMWEETWYPDIFQGRQYHQKPPDDPQRQRSHNQEKWHHLQIQMQQGGLWWWVHRRVIKNFWREV